MTVIDRLIKDMQELKKTKVYASSFKAIDDCLFLAEYYKKEELKQETLEEAAEEYEISMLCAKWQAERMYSEKEVKHIISEALESALVTVDLNQCFEQFKEK